MYLMVRGWFIFLKYQRSWSRSHGPTSASFEFPPVSFSPELCSKVSPQPSATTITAWPCFFMSFMACVKTFGKEMFISGSMQMSTLRADRVPCMAMNPQCRPISFTSPMQFVLLVASTYADAIAFSASEHAVLKPKDLSMIGMSLSMVLGTPTTATSWPISCVHLKVSMAPVWVPSPPMTKYCVMFIFWSDFAMSICSGLPRSLTKMVPPCMWMFWTASGVSFTHFSGCTMPL
mmetsp:Transcript_59552/g.169407  ORF Transcript_59552/g.169407 Transcript_59552/m.169407 type:complete len:233 (-) Transcript_59552:2612-3310(-)